MVSFNMNSSDYVFLVYKQKIFFLQKKKKLGVEFPENYTSYFNGNIMHCNC